MTEADMERVVKAVIMVRDEVKTSLEYGTAMIRKHRGVVGRNDRGEVIPRVVARVATPPLPISPDGCQGRTSDPAYARKGKRSHAMHGDFCRYRRCQGCGRMCPTLPKQEQKAFPTTEEGLTEMASHIHELAPRLVVLEATGGYELPVVRALAFAGLPVVVVNPR